MRKLKDTISHNIPAYFAISVYFRIKEIIVAQKC